MTKYPLLHELPELAADAIEALDNRGCVVLPNRIPNDLLEELREQVDRLFAAEGSAAGSEFRQEEGALRLANLVNKGEVFQRVLLYEPMLAAVSHVLRGNFKLSSMNARTAKPRNGIRQPLHCDMGAVPDSQGYWVCNAIWMLDDFTEANGATRYLPGTHRKSCLPQDELPDLKAHDKSYALVTGEAGSVAVMNAHLWHGGLENTTAAPRRAIHVFFARRDRPQQQYQRQLIEVARQEEFSAPVRWVLALDDAVNDRISSSVGQRSGFLE